MLSFGCEFLVYLLVVFSAQALGAGFRPGVFSSQGFHCLDDGLDCVEVCCGHNQPGYMLFLYLLLRPTASARNKIIIRKKRKKRRKKKEKQKGMGFG